MILMKIVYFVLDKALSSYYSAMEEQVSIIIPIIVALLTGGFIILFLENQHVGANVIERYHFVMQPFMHRLSNYFKFLSSAKVYFSIKSGTSKDKTVYDFNNLMDKLGHMAFPCIMSGQDYPVSHFSACQIQDYSEDINKVWYYLDRNKSNIINDCLYDSNKAENFGQSGRAYLNEIFPHKYDGQVLSLDLIGDVSGTFYVEVYQPIANVPFEYKRWCKKEDEFKKLTFATIGLCVFTLVVILLLRYFTSLCILNILTLLNIVMLASCLYKFSKLELLARKLFR